MVWTEILNNPVKGREIKTNRIRQGDSFLDGCLSPLRPNVVKIPRDTKDTEDQIAEAHACSGSPYREKN